jgi:hypothetical protein
MTDRDAIEEKLAWLERYVLDLDNVVRGLGDEVVALRREVAALKASRAESAEARAGTPMDPDEDPGFDALLYEKPPHY